MINGVLNMLGDAETDKRFMQMALREAMEAFHEDEVPVGAVIVADGKVIAKGHNLTESLTDVTAHAEMIALTAASQYMGGKYLPQCTLYVTVEPCIMCAGALGWSQIGRIVYGASDPKRGYTNFVTSGKTPLHPSTLVSEGILAEEASAIMKEFFSNKRK